MAKIVFETTPERSLLMSKIRAKNTKPEIALRKALWAVGIRYRIHTSTLPGVPDISIKKYRLAIFIDGEFWHGKDWDIKKRTLNKNREYWISKIEANIKRDAKINSELEKMNYLVCRFWSKDVLKNLGVCVKTIVDLIFMRSYETNQFI